MPRFDVHFTHEVSTTLCVEAEDAESAIEAAYQSDDMPGSITHGAFGGGASVDDAGEWDAFSVSDCGTGEQLWTRDGDDAGSKG